MTSANDIAKDASILRVLEIVPMIGPVVFCQLCIPGSYKPVGGYHYYEGDRCKEPCGLVGVDIVVIGGGDEPLHPQWVRDALAQCEAAGVAFVFLGWGEWGPGSYQGQASFEELQERSVPLYPEEPNLYRFGMIRLGKKTAGRILDGETYDWPVTP